MNVLSSARTLQDVLRGNGLARRDKIAFETVDGHSVTFGDFNARVNRLCNAAAELGIAKGDRIAVLSQNRPEYVEVHGMAKSGSIVVPLNWRLTAHELVKVLRHSTPEMLIVDEAHRELAESIRHDLPSVRAFVLLGPAMEGWTSYEQLLSAAPASEPATSVKPDDVACLSYTSGTTGAPKGVALTHTGVLDNCRTNGSELLGLTEDDIAMAVMPLFHVGGMWYHLFPSYAFGCTTLILSKFEPGTVLRELAFRSITNVHIVPTMLGTLVAHPLARTVDLSSVRLLFYAGSSTPPDLLRRAMRTFPRCGFAQSYGSTEAGSVTVLGPEDHRRACQPEGEHLIASCGRPFRDHFVRIVDDLEGAMRQGEVGEIEVRSPGIMKGYWGDEEATRRVLQDGWLKTGDLGYVDQEGYLYVVNRKNDMIVTGGENVFPSEVEAQIFADPDVLDAAVFGIPDPQWVEKVVAAVVFRPGSRTTEDQLLQRLKSRLAAYKCPKTIFITSELPKNTLGKIVRKDLRERYGRVECGGAVTDASSANVMHR